MKSRRLYIPLFCFVTSMFWFSLYAYIPTFSPYVESLGASYKMLGIIIGSYGFTQMLIRIPLGILSDKINKRKIFVQLGLLLGIVSSLGLWLFPLVNLVLLFRSIAGMAAACWVAYTVLFSSYFPRHKTAKAIGIINAFTKLGQMLAMILGGVLAQYLGEKIPFLLAAIAGTIALFFTLAIVEKKEVKRKPLKLKELYGVAKNKQLLSVSFLAILAQLITFATVFGFTPIIARNIGANDFQLGILTTLSTLPAIFASALSGAFFAEKYGERKTVVVGFVITAFIYIMIPYILNLRLLYLVQFIGGFSLGLVYPLLMGLSIKGVADNKRATAMGFFQAIYGLGMFLGPFLVGIISDYASLTLGYWFVGLISISGAILSGKLLSPLVKLKQKGGYISG